MPTSWSSLLIWNSNLLQDQIKYISPPAEPVATGMQQPTPGALATAWLKPASKLSQLRLSHAPGTQARGEEKQHTAKKPPPAPSGSERQQSPPNATSAGWQESAGSRELIKRRALKAD